MSGPVDLHDATLEAVSVLWAQATCTLVVSTATERNVDYVFHGVTELVLPRLQPWGPSVSINAFRVPSAGLFEIEMQSGDVIRIKAEELLIPRSAPRSETYSPKNVIVSSERDGWLLGYVGIPWPGPWPKKSGDLFVTDPDGWQAGIAWESHGPDIATICQPSEDRWGVFQVKFPVPVMSENDLVHNFHLVLPLLKQKREQIRIAGTS